jgi:hypothetical protein
MTMSVVPTLRPPGRVAGRSGVRALACDAGVLAARADDPSGCLALARARARGLRVGLVYDRWPSARELVAAIDREDIIAVPEEDEMTAGGRREVRPEFVARLCAQMDVGPAACLVIGGRRALLAAAAWIGARTVMVPDDATPLFDCRGQRLAPDLASAVAGALVDGGPR